MASGVRAAPRLPAPPGCSLCGTLTQGSYTCGFRCRNTLCAHVGHMECVVLHMLSAGHGSSADAGTGGTVPAGTNYPCRYGAFEGRSRPSVAVTISKPAKTTA